MRTRFVVAVVEVVEVVEVVGIRIEFELVGQGN